jgi:hypothetical protein
MWNPDDTHDSFSIDVDYKPVAKGHEKQVPMFLAHLHIDALVDGLTSVKNNNL